MRKIKIVQKRTQIAIPIRACIVQTIVIPIKAGSIATDQQIVIPTTMSVAIVTVRTIGIQIIMALEVVAHDIGQTIAMDRHQYFRQHVEYRQNIRLQAVDGIHHQLTITSAAIRPTDSIPRIGIQMHGQTVVIPKWTDDITRQP